MKITILGSGGVLGIPVWSCRCRVCRMACVDKKNKKDKNCRTRPSILVESLGKRVIVDIGQDFRGQMLARGITKLDSVLVTHGHLDHTASLAELRAGGDVHLMVPKSVYSLLEKNRGAFTYLKSRNPKIRIEAFKRHKIGDMIIDSIRVLHKKNFSNGPEPCYGYLFTERGFRFAYIPDFGKVLEPAKIKNLDLFICDGATVEPKWGHVGIIGGLELFSRIKPKKMLFTHISHSNLPHDELEGFVKKFGNIRIAYDGMIIRS